MLGQSPYSPERLTDSMAIYAPDVKNYEHQWTDFQKELGYSSTSFSHDESTFLVGKCKPRRCVQRLASKGLLPCNFEFDARGYPNTAQNKDSLQYFDTHVSAVLKTFNNNIARSNIFMPMEEFRKAYVSHETDARQKLIVDSDTRNSRYRSAGVSNGESYMTSWTDKTNFVYVPCAPQAKLEKT